MHFHPTKILILLLLTFSTQAQHVPTPKFKLIQSVNAINSYSSPNTYEKYNPLKHGRSQKQDMITQRNRMLIEKQNFLMKQRKNLYQQIVVEEKKEEGIRAAKQAAAVLRSQKAHYTKAYNDLLDMLAGKRPISVKEAVFTTENAFLQNRMDFSEFNQKVQDFKQTCEGYMSFKGLNPSDYDSKLQALTEMFSDTIRQVVDGRMRTLHYPPSYDFEDPFGSAEFTKLFVSKLLATNSGQCHSMPLLYKIMADEMGIEAYLSYSPSHSYIKVRNKKGQLFNYETTNKHFTTDAWVMGSGFIRAEAVRNRIYMDTLSDAQTVAACLNDLAQGYIHKFGYDEFVLYCANTTLKNYPNSIHAYVLKANYVAYDLQKRIRAVGNPPFSELAIKHPDLYNRMEYLREMYDYIERVGYSEMPDIDYKKWVKKNEEND